jgi:hypothetical protein
MAGIQTGIRTPAEVIALAIEDAGIEPDKARSISEDAAKRLARSLSILSGPGETVVILAEGRYQAIWGTVHGAKLQPAATPAEPGPKAGRRKGGGKDG